MSRSSLQRLKYLLVDFLTANVAILIFDIVRFYVLEHENVGYMSLSSFLTSRVILIEQTLLPLILMAVNGLSGYYNRPLLKSRLQEFINTMLVALLQTVLVYFVLLTNQQTSVRATNYELLLYLYLLLWLLTYAGRYIVTAHAFSRFRTGKWQYNILVIGPKKPAEALAAHVAAHRPLTGFSLAKTVLLPEQNPEAFLKNCDLEKICREPDIREILFTTSGMGEQDILRVLYRLIPLGLPVKVATESLSVLNSNIRLQSIYEEPYIDIASANASDATKNLKRCFDVVVSALMLLVLAIPMGVVALIVKAGSPGGAFFSQERIGRRQRPFRIYKFRSMRTDAEASGPQLSSEQDPRITREGAWLRKYRIDELPQFWNVLKGDMSLVGPRPERRHFINKIMERAPYYSLVHQVRPGITSWGMVKYGYAASVDEMIERLRYDLVYLANMSVTNDLKIIIYTVKTVIKGRGM